MNAADAEKTKLEAYYTSTMKLLGSATTEGGVYALAYRPDGTLVAVGGEDGKVRFVDSKDARVLKEFVPVPIGTTTAAAGAR